MGYGYSENDKVSFSELHFIAFIIHLVSAIFATALVPGNEFATRALTFTQYDIKTVNNHPAIVESFVNIFNNANPILLVALNEWFTCVSHLVGYIIVMTSNTINEYRDGYSRESEYMRRWIEYAITAGLLEIALIIGLGETNLLIVLVVLMNNVALQLLGWSLDINRKNVPLTMISGFLLLGTTILILSTHVANQIGLQMEWGYLVTIFSIFYASFGVHQTLYMTMKNYRESFDVDKIYICLSMTAKIVLSWTFIAVYRKTFVRLDKPMEPTVVWETEGNNTWDWIMGLLAGFGAVFIIVFYLTFGKSSEKRIVLTRGKREFDKNNNNLLF